MTVQHQPDQPLLTAADDNWHEYSAHWWETETNWWSFNVPERKLGGWLYTQVLANQGTCNGGAWVWDDSDAGAVYEQRHQGLPFPERGDLRNVTFPNGVSLQMLEPLMKYRTTYSDKGQFECDLVHTGIIAAHSHPVGAWPFWATRHFDQPMHVTGTIVLRGETIPVDCYSLRDRSWGPRPTGPTPPDKKVELPRPNKPVRANYTHSVGYVFATQDADNGFVAFTDPWVDRDGHVSDDLDTGYLLHDGEYAPLVRGFRTTELAPGTRFITNIHLEATDTLGRDLIADGELISRHGVTGPSGTGLFHWTWSGGREGWGEDQSYGPSEWFEALDGLSR
jgi:hypothetical protein